MEPESNAIIVNLQFLPKSTYDDDDYEDGDDDGDGDDDDDDGDDGDDDYDDEEEDLDSERKWSLLPAS